MMGIRTLSKQDFDKSVSEHEMTVLHNAGIYRHLRFKKPNSNNQYFDITTFPNHLVISGDMGDFTWRTWCKDADIFNGFSPNRLLAGKNKEFSSEALRGEINDVVESCCEDIADHFEDYEGDDYENVNEFEQAFREEVSDYFDSCELDEYRCVSAIEDFSSCIIPDCNLFEDFWSDFNADVPTYHYQWSVMAVYYAIEQYKRQVSCWTRYSTSPSADGTYRVRAKDETEFDIVTVKNGEIYDQDNDIVLCIDCEWQKVNGEVGE